MSNRVPMPEDATAGSRQEGAAERTRRPQTQDEALPATHKDLNSQTQARQAQREVLQAAEKALRESEARYRGLFENMVEGFAYCQMLFENGEPSDFVYLAVNEAFETLTGLKGVTGKRVTEVIPGIRQSDPELFAIYARVALTGQPERFEMLVQALAMWFSISVYSPEGGCFVAVFDVITERKRADQEREATLAFLHLANESVTVRGLIEAAARFFQQQSGCQAVGIRLREGDDYPYFEACGFPPEFVRAENSLCARDAAGGLRRDSTGLPVLECMCGNVLCGRFDPAKPFFTAGGSFWTNSTTQLLASTSEADRQARTRNRCNGEGYESVALIPLPAGGERLGLLQLNDRRQGRFTPEVIALWERLAGYLAVALAKLRTEETLRESEKRFRLLVESSPEAIFVQTQGRFAYLNGAAVRLFGASSADDLLGQPILDRIHPSFRETAQERIRILNEERLPAPHMEGTWLRLDGSPVPVEGSAVPILYEGNDGALAFVMDITERKQAEEERERLQSQLIQAQKMESVGRLAGGVAHDFNNMLSVILGHAELARMQAAASDPVQADLEEIQKAAERSADLTRQLLAFARKQTVAPRVLDLNETVEGMLKMLRRLIGEDIHLAWLPGKDLWPVKVDPSQIDQILANLCVNARDAIADVGRVTIETADVTFDADYCALHVGFVPGEFVRLAVSDDGCGMDQETLGHLFEPFFTTKGMGKGTGLGLATVYGIVKQNNGFINVYSEPGQGTTFKIYLPRHAAKARPVRPEGQASPVARGHETILLVEDEPAILDLIRTMMESFGYQVLTASTPGEAIRQTREHVGEIDLLLSDVVMPEMNGRDLANHLLSFYPGMKRLFMSGYTANVIAHHGVLDEGVHFIQKPFSMKDLAVKVREVLEHS